MSVFSICRNDRFDACHRNVLQHLIPVFYFDRSAADFAPILSISCECSRMKVQLVEAQFFVSSLGRRIVSVSLKSSKLNRRMVNEFEPIPAIFSSTYELKP